jgi:MFS transporter, CP family, cyanate transporter
MLNRLPGTRGWPLALGLLALSLNLRAPVAGYPPVLAEVRTDLGVSAAQAGAAPAAAVLAMAVGPRSWLGWARCAC